MIDIPSLQKTHFIQFNLSDLLDQLGEDFVKQILSSFSCPLNPDVEYFLKAKAIEMSKRNFSKTYLVYWETEDGNEKELVGYYALAPTLIFVDPSAVSKRQKRKLHEYGVYNEKTCQYVANAILIGQLGKNFANGNDSLISGSDLLQMAIDKAREVQNLVGGRFIYLECEDKPKLLKFYTDNNFTIFGERDLDRDETDKISSRYLKQLFALL